MLLSCLRRVLGKADTGWLLAHHICVKKRCHPNKCQLDSELGKELLKDAQRQEAGEEAAAETADDSGRRDAERPAQESLGPEPPQGIAKLPTPEPWSVSRSPDHAPAETSAMPLLLMTFKFIPTLEHGFDPQTWGSLINTRGPKEQGCGATQITTAGCHSWNVRDEGVGRVQGSADMGDS